MNQPDPITTIMRFQSDRKLDKQPYNWENEFMNVIEEALEAKGYDIPKSQRERFLRPIIKYIRSKAATNAALPWNEPTEEAVLDAHLDQIVFNIGAIMKLGYDPISSLVECSKEINSRQGIFIKGKFEKFKQNEKGYKKTYKANYRKSKLKG